MFIPARILFEKGSFNYEIGKQIYQKFITNKEVALIELQGNKIMEHIPGATTPELYQAGKNTLVVGTWKGQKFQTCKPSAHYQLPLLSGCIGHCQYCYLNTNLGNRPYIKIHVNVADILGQAEQYLLERTPEITIFEGSATSDPVPVEPYSTLLRKTIEFFGNSSHGRFRFVTKYTEIDSLLDLIHHGHTEIRFTLNTDSVIKNFENRTPSMAKRIDASIKVLQAGYPMGYLIAPVFLYEGWREEYQQLLLSLRDRLPKQLPHPLTFEIISHRYTPRAKEVINDVFPDNVLPMSEEDRSYQYGQFGYGKFVYPKEQLSEISAFFQKEIASIFHAYDIEIKYII